jgi:hypothetical protein
LPRTLPPYPRLKNSGVRRFDTCHITSLDFVSAGTNERPQARGYPTHRNSKEKENKAASSVSRPMYGGQSSSSPPTASTQSSTQAPTPRTLPSNPPIHNVNATPKDGVAAYTGTPQRAAQRTTGFDHASTPGGGNGNRENAYTSTVGVTRLDELGKQAPYTSGTGVSRSDAPSQNQTAPNSGTVPTILHFTFGLYFDSAGSLKSSSPPTHYLTT